MAMDGATVPSQTVLCELNDGRCYGRGPLRVRHKMLYLQAGTETE